MARRNTVTELDAGRVRANLAAVREEIAAAAARAGRDPGDVEVLTAVKYVPVELMGVLAEAGVTLVGENRAQDLEAKRDALPDAFTWDFIGQLQSRKVKAVLPHVRWIHSVASDSALEQLGKHGTPETEVLLEVDVAGEDTKAGFPAAELAAVLERCPVTVVGLMTMPPWTEDPEGSRRPFAALRELAAAHDLPQLSMGTTQDFAVAVEEGATIVRVGSRLFS
jgi:pyridoxal phosphate enzyme (YggS family)